MSNTVNALRIQIATWRTELNTLIGEPAAATALAQDHRAARMQALAVQIDSALREIALIQAAERANWTQRDSLTVSLLASLPIGTSTEAAVAHRDAMLAALLTSAPVAENPQMPLPLPPVQENAPQELSDEQAAALMAIMAPEMAQHNVIVSVANVKRLWREFWRPQGRRWGPSTPGWGPLFDSPDRPVVFTPWP